MGTLVVDAVGNLHDTSGRFSGHVHSEADAGAVLSAAGGPPDGGYSQLRDPKLRAERMRDDLEAAIDEIVSSGQLQSYLDARALSPLRRWSFGNQILAELQYRQLEHSFSDATRQKFPEPMLMSRSAWLRQGRHLIRGAQTIWIRRPRVFSVTDTDPATGQERKRVVTAGFTGQAEYDISQTDGDPVEGYGTLRPAMITGDIPAGANPGLSARIIDAGYTVSEEPIPGFDPLTGNGAYGYTAPATKQVVIDPRTPPATRMHVYAHELAHIKLGHVEDLAGYAKHRGRMETEAEATAYIVTRALGANPAGSEAFSAPYIARWSHGEPTGTIGKALDRAAKVANDTLDGTW